MRTHTASFPRFGKNGTTVSPLRTGWFNTSITGSWLICIPSWNTKRPLVFWFCGKRTRQGVKAELTMSAVRSVTALLPSRCSDLALARRWAEKKIHFPSLQTAVRASVIEGLRIDLNYFGCLQKLSKRGGRLKKVTISSTLSESSPFFFFQMTVSCFQLGFKDQCDWGSFFSFMLK